MMSLKLRVYSMCMISVTLIEAHTYTCTTYRQVFACADNYILRHARIYKCIQNK